MRERRQKPKVVKFSSLSWLVNFLNLRFNSQKPRDRKKVEAFLAESIPQDDAMTAINAQERIIDEITPVATMQTFSPEGLVYHLNDWAQTNNIHPYWFLRPLENVRYLNAGESTLRLGSQKWQIIRIPLVHGTEGRALMSISQCLTNGELSKIRRCFECKRFFITDDLRQRFCRRKHQRVFDAKAAKERVKLSRERRRAKDLGIRQPKREPQKPISPVSDEQRFVEFLNLARGNVIAGSELALFIKKKIPGDWRTVKRWLTKAQAANVIWGNLTETMKVAFRNELWGTGQEPPNLPARHSRKNP